MARVIDVEVERERIKIDFPYEAELVDVVRTLPDRWFDRRTKCWFVPIEHLEYVIQRLDGYHFKFSPRLRTFRSNRDDNAVVEPAVPEIPEGTWTVSRLNQAARAALRERFDDRLWIVGELQDFDKNRAGDYRTWFFDLVERPFAGANEVARLKAVLFERHRRGIEKRLRDSNIELADGLAVRLRGRVDLYAKNGRYQLVVDDIDPAYTAGEIEMNRERVFRALKKRGIENENRALPWPTCPLRVGLITSWESDAYNDFVHQLRDSGRGFSLTVHHANVQGVHTERSVLRALAYFRRHADAFDVVAIVRGGGSRSELAYFDTEAIGEAVCRHPLKIVCGVGHQRDTSLLDLIAESTKTPTAAAGRIVRQVDDYVRCVDQTYEAIARRAERQVAKMRRRLVRSAARLERQVVGRLNAEHRRQDALRSSVDAAVHRLLARRGRRLDNLAARLTTAAERGTERRRMQVEQARATLSLRRLKQRLQRRRHRLRQILDRLRKSSRRDTDFARRRIQHLEEQLALVDPRRILERGFAIVSDDEGVIHRRADVPLGHDFDVLFGDGVLRARRIERRRCSDGESSAVDEASKPESTVETAD